MTKDKTEIETTAQDKPQDLFPIRTVASLTGVNAITLRAWEKRYGLIKPTRTPKGHRLYTQENIDSINEVVNLLAKGIPISQVTHSLKQRQTPSKRNETDSWSDFINKMLSAIRSFNEDALNSTYNEALSLYPVEIAIQKLIIPLLTELGRRWETKEGSVAEEHYFGVFLRNKLGARFHHGSPNTDGRHILAACLPGEYHENGLLLFSLSAQSRGFRLTILGTNMPIEEVAMAAARSKSEAIVLSGSNRINIKALLDPIEHLVNSTKLPVFIGGKTSSIYFDDIVRTGAIPLGDDITQGIKLITSSLDSAE